MLNNIVALLGNGVAASTNSYESIATVTVGAGGSSTITFSSIPSTYKHLQLRGLVRSTAVTNASPIKILYNSDSTMANYNDHWLEGTGASVGAGRDGSSHYFYNFPAANATASVFGVAVIDILDYINANKYKTTRNLAGYDNNGSGFAEFGSGLWLSTSAISQIDITLYSGNFAQYSSFALYGVKG